MKIHIPLTKKTEPYKKTKPVKKKKPQREHKEHTIPFDDKKIRIVKKSKSKSAYRKKKGIRKYRGQRKKPRTPTGMFSPMNFPSRLDI